MAGVSGFSVYDCYESCNFFYKNIKKRYTTVFFNFHCEVYIVDVLVELVKTIYLM